MLTSRFDMPPKVYEPGKSLTDEEKAAILKDVSKAKAEQKAVADKAKAAKVSAELGVAKKAPAAGKPAASSSGAAAKKPAASGAASAAVSGSPG